MRYHPLSVILLLLMTVVFVSCGSPSATSSQADVAETTSEPIRVGILRIDDSLPIAAAVEDGDYEAAGLNVEVYPFKSSSDQSKALESGELDVVMNDMVVQGLLKKAEIDTKVISYAFGATPQEGRFVVVAAPDSGIQDPVDLVGQPIAISTNTMMEYLMDQYAEYFALPKAEMSYVNMPNLMLRLETVVEGKDVKAAILPDPLASFAIQQGCIPVIDDTTLDENFSQSVILATDEIIANRHEDVQKFLDVTFEKMTDINDNADNYREFALNQANVPESLKDVYPVPTFSPHRLPSEEEVNRVMLWLKEKELVDDVYDYRIMVDDQFIHGS